MTEDKRIIYFDGVCNLCSWSVRFVLKYDKKALFSFASLQSAFAAKSLTYTNGQDINYNSVTYQKGDIIYTQSDAVLTILKDMGNGWVLMYFFKIIPKPWRDGLYDFIARHRYSWFGKKDHCIVPSPEMQSRFLD